MASLRETAEHHIAEDPVLREAVKRGIVNARDVARWLQDHEGIEADTEALANPIRDIGKDADSLPLDRGEELLARSEVITASGRALLVIDREDRIEQKLSRLLSEMDLRVDDLSMRTERGTIRIVVDQDNVEETAEALDSLLTRDPKEGLAELRIRTEGAVEGSQVLGAALKALTAVGIDVVHVGHGEKIQSLLVDEADKGKALRVLEGA